MSERKETIPIIQRYWLRQAQAADLREGYENNPHPNLQPRSELLWLAVDLDGTLAEPVWTPENPTSQIGSPIWSNVVKLLEAVEAGYKVIIHTSRADTDYESIESWLNHYEIPFKEIRTGKPLASLYIDDRGRHADAESWLPERKK
jgi:hypothetical protein